MRPAKNGAEQADRIVRARDIEVIALEILGVMEFTAAYRALHTVENARRARHRAAACRDDTQSTESRRSETVLELPLSVRTTVFIAMLMDTSSVAAAPSGALIFTAFPR